MSRKINYFNRAVKLLQELNSEYPSFEIGRHIDTAFSDYGSLWGISNKEFCFALEKYKAELELDSNNIVSDEYVEKIKKDAEDLNTILNEEEEEEDVY